MSLLDPIKKLLSSQSLRRDMRSVQRERGAFSIEQANTVGIVFQYNGPEDFELLKKYVLYLREMKKKVRAVGLYTTKELPQFSYSKLEFDFFGKRQFSWFGRPADPTLRTFTEEPYDILIDLNLSDALPLRYLVALSRAKFKVGRWQADDNALHDLLIDSPPEKGLKFFLRNVDTYLLKLRGS